MVLLLRLTVLSLLKESRLVRGVYPRVKRKWKSLRNDTKYEKIRNSYKNFRSRQSIKVILLNRRIKSDCNGLGNLVLL